MNEKRMNEIKDIIVLWEMYDKLYKIAYAHPKLISEIGNEVIKKIEELENVVL